MRVLKESIPAALANLRHWVNWRNEVVDNRPTKVPYSPRSGKRASSTDPATWGTLDEAVASADGGGIGFVFSRDVGITGVDLDLCRLPETGEIAPWAQAIVAGIDSYTEVSPSGRGLHIIAFGTLPEGPRRKEVTDPDAARFAPPGEPKKPGIEMYDDARYFTFTGDHLDDTPTQVEDRQERLEALHAAVFQQPMKPRVQSRPRLPVRLEDAVLLEKARKAKNGADFERLFSGDTSGYPSASEADLALCSHLAFWTGGDEAQMDRLFRQAGLMREKWERPMRAGGETYGEHTLAKAAAAATEVYSGPRVPPLVEAATAAELIYFQHNDAGNAQRLITTCGDALRFCHVIRKWFIFDGRRWMLDEIGQAKKAMKAVMHEFYRQARAAGNEEAEKFARRSLNDSKVNAALSSAECELPVTPEQLDRDAYLLNCLNGTIDLRTSILSPHKRDNFITKLCHFDYDPSAKCPLFLRFLNHIMGAAEDPARAARLACYLQKVFGYALTSDVSAKAVFCFFGSGNNGKSTLLSTFRHVIEEYSALLQIETLMAHQQENNNTQADLADLRGARFAVTSETEEGQKLAVGKLKRITQGMGKIKAVRKYENPIEFAETHKLFMDANHRPIIPETEKAIWNRLKPIPFTVTIPDAEIDHELPEKLKDEAEGILAWAVEGCLRWQREGLGHIDEVDRAAEEWRAESSRFAEFLEERCVVDLDDPNCFIPVSVLWPEYQKWAQANGEPSMLTKQAFDDHLMKVGCEIDRPYHLGKRTRVRRGIRLRTHADDRKVA